MQDQNVLVWLPSPMGDAILCTPALRAIRQYFKSCKISFFANRMVRDALSPSSFNDAWLEQHRKNPFTVAKMLKEHNFTHAILFKNSFASALTVFLAGIPSRIGYAREGRGPLLTDKLYPRRLPNGKFKPRAMLDYYLAIASWLGADTTDRKLELFTDTQKGENLRTKLPEVADATGAIIVIVPGGAFGPSKCWSSERFAQTADWLIAKYNATVVVSVAPNAVEKQIAAQICGSSTHRIINLAERTISLGELKALFSKADLVISNDTGPRHIAIALQRKLITLFGPNNPIWTDTGYENEIKVVGNAPCAPCDKPICKKSEHLCMQAITVEKVCDAAKKLLENTLCHSERSEESLLVQRCVNLSCKPYPSALPQDDKGDAQRQPSSKQEFIEVSKSLFVDPDYETALSNLGLSSIDAVFSFAAAKNLTKHNLARHRARLQFEIGSPQTTAFLKRYDRPPIVAQLRSWSAAHRRVSCGLFEFGATSDLAAAGINTPKILFYAEQWGIFFEKRSFIVTQKIPNAESLERKLPNYFDGPASTENLKLTRNFIAQLAGFVKRFHETGYRHRDLYFSHIFYSDSGGFYLIDLARAFKPIVLRRRFQIKDIAQLYYSAPAKYFSGTDRLRFYLEYAGQSKLTAKDKVFVRRVVSKAKWMARHDAKHGRVVPFARRQKS